MKKLMLLLTVLIQTIIVFGQDRTFLYVGKYENEEKLKHLGDSLNKPLLITDDKIYSIGTDCLTRLFDKNINDRDNNGDINNRNKGNENNNRNKGGDILDRKNSGSQNDRNNYGDVDNREKGNDINNRNADGGLSNEPKCSTSKNGKILLYTTKDIDNKRSKIFYNNDTIPLSV